jgi:hypothetical protein
LKGLIRLIGIDDALLCALVFINTVSRILSMHSMLIKCDPGLVAYLDATMTPSLGIAILTDNSGWMMLLNVLQSLK